MADKQKGNPNVGPGSIYPTPVGDAQDTSASAAAQRKRDSEAQREEGLKKVQEDEQRKRDDAERLGIKPEDMTDKDRPGDR